MGLNNSLLREGARGPEVRRLQTDLVAAGMNLGKAGVDGDYGPATESAVRTYQQRHDLVADGIAGPKTRAHLAGKPLPATLKQSDLVAASKTLAIDLPAIIAVNEVESRGRGFIGNLPVVLFERHIMYRQLNAHGRDAKSLAEQYPHLVNPTPGGYLGGTAENVRLSNARKIDDVCGAESASYGLFQILGEHAVAIGYQSAPDYAAAMGKDEANQLQAFVRFIESDATLHDALQAHDWKKFAEHYNGPAYWRHDYDTRLAAAYRRHAAYNHPKKAA